MSSFYEFTCYGGGGPSDIPLCYLFTCEQCGNILIYGTCATCNSGTENSFTYDPNLESFNEVQIISNPPPQSHYNICQICKSNSHYGYECSQRVSLVYEPEPCYNQSFGDNDYPRDLPGVTPRIDHHCCYKCGDSLDGFFCYQCTCEFCGNGAHDGYNCPSHVPLSKLCQVFRNNVLVVKIVGVLMRLINYPVNPSFNIQNELDDHELFINKLIQQKLNENAQSFSAIAITLDLPTLEPEDSLRMRDEHLDTISEMESDEFIKSSVENLVPNLSESEDLSDSVCDVPTCDDFTTFSNLLFDVDDDFSSSDNKSCFDEDISKEIYSNPLFDKEIISIKMNPHHLNAESDLIESLLNHDSSIISSSSKIDSLIDEFTGELILLKSIPPRIDETNCNPEEEIQSFCPSSIPVEDSDSFMKETDLSFTPNDSMPPGIEEDDCDSERDMLIFEGLLSNNSLSLPENESFHFDIPSSPRPHAKPPDDDEIKPNSRILTVKVHGKGTGAMEKMVEKLGNVEDKTECKKLKKELEEARFCKTFLFMQNERVERDLYWTRVRAHEFYQEMIRRGFIFFYVRRDIIMPPKFAPLTQAAIRRMIKESVDAAIATERARHANAGNDARGSGPVRGQDVTPAIRECTFAGFMKCNLNDFHCTEGAIELQRWFEKTESVFGISECAKGKKVKFSVATLVLSNRISLKNEHKLWNLKLKEYNIVAYTQRFNELALMRLRTVEPKRVKVDAYIWGLTDNIKGEVTSSKPANLNEAVCIAHKLME
nr:hypothetical protein [Tanacetum cinerariifolium]